MWGHSSVGRAPALRAGGSWVRGPLVPYMKDLKCIKYKQLKNLISAVQLYIDEENKIENGSEGIICLFEDQNLNQLQVAIVNYIDEILNQSYDNSNEDASYFVWETDFGRNRYKDEPMSIFVDKKEYKIKDFDSWYRYLLAMEKEKDK